MLLMGGKSKRWEGWKRKDQYAGELGPGISSAEQCIFVPAVSLKFQVLGVYGSDSEPSALAPRE